MSPAERRCHLSALAFHSNNENYTANSKTLRKHRSRKDRVFLEIQVFEDGRRAAFEFLALLKRGARACRVARLSRSRLSRFEPRNDVITIICSYGTADAFIHSAKPLNYAKLGRDEFDVRYEMRLALAFSNRFSRLLALRSASPERFSGNERRTSICVLRSDRVRLLLSRARPLRLSRAPRAAAAAARCECQARGMKQNNEWVIVFAISAILMPAKTIASERSVRSCHLRAFPLPDVDTLSA